MKAKPSANVTIPGLELSTLVRILALGIPVTLAFGLRAIPVFLLLGLFSRIFLKLWVRDIGPPIANASIEREHVINVRLMIALITVPLMWAIFGLNGVVLLFVVLAALAWFRPSAAAMVVLFIAAAARPEFLLPAAPVVVMLARRDGRMRFGLPRSLRRTVMSGIFAFAAFLAMLPFVNSTVGSPDGSAEQATQSQEASGDQSLMERVTAWLMRDDGQETPSRLVQVPGANASPDVEDSFPWQMWLAIGVAAVAVAAVLVWWWRRRGKGNPAQVGGDAPASTLARLEMIGASVGRERSEHEGALTFASELAAHTGDQRLDATGPLVSGDVYASASIDPYVVAERLAEVEASPPPPPPDPALRERAGDWIRLSPITKRGAVVSACAVLGLVALGWAIVPKLGDLREPERQLAYSALAEAPDEWHELMAAAPADLVGWQSCSSSWDVDAVTWSQAGLSHRERPLAAQMGMPSASGNASRATVSVGTDQMTATVWTPLVDSVPIDGDDEWHQSEGAFVPLHPYPSLAAVLQSLFVHEPVRSEQVDRGGEHYVRHESLPIDWEQQYDSQTWSSAPAPQANVDNTELMWVVDVWETNGVPTRVRVMSDAPSLQWSEWRRLENVEPDRLRAPDCVLDAPFGDDIWVGRERWTPTRSAPQQIGFDTYGRPYDKSRWSDPASVTSETIGDIPGPIENLNIGDLYDLATDRDSAQTWTVHLSWAEGAELTMFEEDGWPVAVRVDEAGGADVVTWAPAQRIEIYESFVTMTTAAAFPGFGWEEVEPIIAPLWDGSAIEVGDVGGEVDSQLIVLTQSDASALVVGRDGTGDIASIVIWYDYVEWRYLGIDAQAPPAVVEREAQLQDCLAGDRRIETSGRCQEDQ